MRPHERAELARRTYLRAVALARAESTAASWRRLLQASKNLKAALRERDGGRVRWYARAPAGDPRAPAPATAGAEGVRVVPPPPPRDARDGGG